MVFVIWMAGYVAFEGHLFETSFLFGAIVLITIVSGLYVVALGREFVAHIDRYV